MRETNGSPDADESGRLFEGWWRMMEATGKPLHPIRDLMRAQTQWGGFSLDDHRAIVAWSIEQLKTTWTSAKYTPMPHRILEDQGWTRVAKERLIPTPREESKSAASTRRAGQMAREKWGYT